MSVAFPHDEDDEAEGAMTNGFGGEMNTSYTARHAKMKRAVALGCSIRRETTREPIAATIGINILWNADFDEGFCGRKKYML